MPSYDKVSIMDRSGAINYYSSYSSAIAMASSGDLIQIWADLDDEQIELMNGVDIWILPAVVLKYPSSQATVVAPSSGELNCKIYGKGVIKNETSGNCIFIDNEEAELEIECDSIEGINGFGSSVSVNVKNANKIHIKCNTISNRDFQAIRFGELLSPGLIMDVNLNIEFVETGNITTSSPYTGTTAISMRGNGFLRINEIKCRNLGHCLSQREGSIIANIQKLTTTNNYLYFGSAGATVHVRQYNNNTDTGNQKLILYFDEVKAVAGAINSSTSIEVGEGTGIFIGRGVYSKNSPAIQIVGTNTKGFINCNELTSTGNADTTPVNAIEFSSFTNQIIIDANIIQGYRDSGVIFINGANIVIKNAKVINTYMDSAVASVGLFIYGEYIISLINLKIVTGNTTSGKTIYYAGPLNDIEVKNYGLYVNKFIEEEVLLLIGIKDIEDPEYNYLYTKDLLLT